MAGTAEAPEQGAPRPRLARAPLPRRVASLALLLIAAACAKEEAPPGALPDSRPPDIRETDPADGAVVPDFDGELRLRFDEPFRVPGDFTREVFGSPADRYRVAVSFSEIRVRPEGGWRSGVVYTITFPAGIADLLSNRTDEPIVVTFSTGPPVTSTRAEGRAFDRLTGRPLSDVRVLFLALTGDSVPYTAVTDREGRFALRSLPPGRYRAFGFDDLNRDRLLQRGLEPYDSATFRLRDAASSASLTLRLTEPDSTAPVLGRIEARDSVTLALEFDDPLDPEQDFGAARVSVADTATGARWPVAAVAPPGREEGGERPAEGEEEVDPRRPGPGGAVGGLQGPRPDRVVVVRLGRPLADGVYRVTAGGFRNLRGLEGGGEGLLEYGASPAEPSSDGP